MSFLLFLIGVQVGLIFGVFWGSRPSDQPRPENLAHRGYREADRIHPDDDTEGGVL